MLRKLESREIHVCSKSQLRNQTLLIQLSLPKSGFPNQIASLIFSLITTEIPKFRKFSLW